jgi:release factor glutamine methyltransferase
MENTPVKVKIMIDEFKKELIPVYGPEEVMQFVVILFREWMGWSRADISLNRETILKGQQILQFRTALADLLKNKPIQYIIGLTDFLDLKIKIREGVLIPRLETEELVTMIIRDFRHRQFENLSLLDIGTGSGCIAVTLKKQMPRLDVSATDISIAALELAAENSLLNKCPVRFILSDILSRADWKEFPGYTIIVSNPPYVTQSERSSMHLNVVEYEPHVALFVEDEDPLQFYQAIGEFALQHLLRPGFLYLEINERFGKRISELLLSLGFDKADVQKDIHGKDRFIRAVAKSTMLDTSYWNVEH